MNPTAREAILLHALRFYADSSRYDGPNKRLTKADPYTPAGAGYRQDVTRDNGEIARAALAQFERGDD